MVVAVIDDGADLSHPDLQGQGWTNPDEIAGNGVDDDNNGYVDDTNGWDFYNRDNTVHDMLEDAHGTHVAGTIAGSENGEGVVGVAPGVKVMPVKWLGPFGGRLSDAIKAIEYAKKEGARISNNSWGYEGKPSRALEETIRRSGMLFVAAAGNGGRDGRGDDNDADPNRSAYPASYDLPNVLSVAAANNQGRLAGFSNYGKRSVDIAAPGVDILSSVPVSSDEPGVALSPVGDSGRALTVGFGIEEVEGEANRARFAQRLFETVGRTDEPVVVVDDDRSSSKGWRDATPPVAEAIEAATGEAPEVIDVPSGDGPDVSRLRGKIVVWSTGSAIRSTDAQDNTDPADQFHVEPNLTRADRGALNEFLGGGGKLVLTGDEILRDVGESSFVLDTLKLDVHYGYIASAFEGASGTAFGGETYDLYPLDDSSEFNTVVGSGAASTQVQGTIGSDTYESWSGTSMAAPHAAGAAALVASEYPGLESRPLALKKAVMENGKPLPETRGKTATGRMVNAQKAVIKGAPAR